MMNIAALQTFLAVVETRNLNKAAERLNVTQSTVTARLDALDAALGQRLLVRARRGAELTKAGFAFQRHAELAVQSWEQGKKAVGLPRGFSGLLSIACHHDLWEGAGATWVEAVRDLRPELALEVWPGDAGDIRRWLASGLVDVAILLEPVASTDITSRELMTERLVQVSTEPRCVTAWHPRYVYVDLGPDFRRQHSLTWPTDETAHVTFGSSRWALDYLLSHDGSAYLPWRLTRHLIAAGQLHAIDGSPEFSRTLHLAVREAALQVHPWIGEINLETHLGA